MDILPADPEPDLRPEGAGLRALRLFRSVKGYIVRLPDGKLGQVLDTSYHEHFWSALVVLEGGRVTWLNVELLTVLAVGADASPGYAGLRWAEAADPEGLRQ